MTTLIRSFSKLNEKDGKFYPEPEYPKWAWYEAIVNACAHRSYMMKNAIIFVKLFDDRLVIESPGAFPSYITPENIYDMSYPRNFHLMWALFYLKYVRCAHEGTRRIRDTMLDMKLPPPEFTQKSNGHVTVRVTLRNNIDHRRTYVDRSAADLIGAVIASTLTPRKLRVINFAAEYGKINITEAVRVAGGAWETSKKLLNGLVSKGIFDRHARDDVKRADPKGYYTLKKPPQMNHARR